MTLITRRRALLAGLGGAFVPAAPHVARALFLPVGVSQPSSGGGLGAWALIAHGSAQDNSQPVVTINSTGANLIICGMDVANGFGGGAGFCSDAGFGNTYTPNAVSASTGPPPVAGSIVEFNQGGTVGSGHAISLNAIYSSLLASAWSG